MTAVITIVISSLGNRPQGSKWVYISCIFLFVIIMAALLYLGGYTMYRFYLVAMDNYSCCKTAKNSTSCEISCPANVNSTISFTQTLFETAGFTDLLIAFISTYGLYVFQSLLYFDPWHMLTSCFQYLLFLPTYVNILNVYACKIFYLTILVCNLHDVSWGTKGDNKAESLGGATAVKGKDGQVTVSLDIPTDRKDINGNYEVFVRELQTPRSKAISAPDAKTKQEDYFRSFRTNVVLFWFLCNAVLIVALTNEQSINAINEAFRLDLSGRSNPYLKIMFYSDWLESTGNL